MMDISEYQQAIERFEQDQLSCKPELPKVSTWEKIRLRWKSLLEKAIVAIETQFKPLPSDIILISYPKTGTTWLKALTFSIINFRNSKQNDIQVPDPLLTQSPHQLVPFLEVECFGEQPTFDITNMTSSPRVFSTHIPYSRLPENIKTSGCKIVYITRNPMDTFISFNSFYKKDNPELTIEEGFPDFCRGVVTYGLYFDHALEYWRAYNERPAMLHFLTYEDLKQDPDKHVSRLADFIGCSLRPSEIEEIVERCSFNRLSNLAVNRDTSNVHWIGLDFSSFFRKGIVNDWRNYLTPEMVEQMRELANQKWEGAEELKCQLVDAILGSPSG